MRPLDDEDVSYRDASNIFLHCSIVQTSSRQFCLSYRYASIYRARNDSYYLSSLRSAMPCLDVTCLGLPSHEYTEFTAGMNPLGSSRLIRSRRETPIPVFFINFTTFHKATTRPPPRGLMYSRIVHRGSWSPSAPPSRRSARLVSAEFMRSFRRRFPGFLRAFPRLRDRRSRAGEDAPEFLRAFKFHGG